MSRERKPVVLILGPLKAKGGISSVINPILKQAIGDKFNFIKVNTSLYKDGGMIGEIGTSLKAVLQCIIILTFRSVDLIHIHSSAFVSFYRKSILGLIGALSGKKVIYHLHSSRFYEFFYDPPNRLVRSYIRRTLKSAAAVICLCEDWKKCLEERYQLENVTVIPNPVGSVKQGNKSFFLDNVKLLFMGFYIRNKGVMDLLEVSKELSLKGFKFTLEICGKGEMDSFINNYIKENSLEDYIINVGWVEGNQKEYILRNADIFVLPSYAEGMPVSILEAFSYGLPVVATKISCVPALVEDGINGFLIEAGNRKELFDKVTLLISNKALCETISRNNIIKSKDYLFEEIAGEWENVYRGLLK